MTDQAKDQSQVEVGAPFQMPEWRKRFHAQKFRAQDGIVSRTMSQIDTLIAEAIQYVVEHYVKTKHYHEPNLNSLYQIGKRYYHTTIKAGYEFAQAERTIQKGKKKLGLGPPTVPKTLDDFQKFFKSSKGWPVAIQRNKKLIKKYKKQYLKLIQTEWNAIVPALDSGAFTPKEVKQHLFEQLKKPRAQIETIFRTEVTNYFAKTQISTAADDPEVIGFLFDSVRDKARTAICKTRHGMVFRPGTELLKENTPSLHFNCRSHLLTLVNIDYNRQMLNDPKRDPERQKSKFAPLMDGWRTGG